MSNDSKSLPLVILGLDAGDPELIRRWAEEGHLPNLASVMQNGCWGKTSGAELISAHGVWLSIFSGISLRKQGYHYFRQLKPKTYELEIVSAYDLNISPFWQSFLEPDSEDLVPHIAIIDVPDTLPIQGLSGIQLADWAVHDGFLPPTAIPSELLQEVLVVFGEQMIIEANIKSGFDQDRQIHNQLLERIKKKGNLCRHLLAKDHFDLIVAVFGEPHTAGHQFWKYQPGSQSIEKVTEFNELTNGIRDIYQAIDQEIGLLLEQLPKNSNFCLVSSVGIQDQYPSRGLIEDFCHKLGYQTTAKSSAASLNPIKLIRQIIPESWRVAISKHFPGKTRERLLSDKFRSNTDWTKTIAFSTPSTYNSLLRVNLRGREPEGIVEMGNEYEQVLDKLQADLEQLIDPNTGQAVVKQVVRSNQAFNCDPLTSSLPDLFVEWQPCPYFLERVIHPRAELNQQKPEFFRGSNHSQIGFFAAAGLDIKQQGAIADISVLDLAPTFLTLMGEKIPEYMVGEPIEQIK